MQVWGLETNHSNLYIINILLNAIWDLDVGVPCLVMPCRTYWVHNYKGQTLFAQINTYILHMYTHTLITLITYSIQEKDHANTHMYTHFELNWITFTVITGLTKKIKLKLQSTQHKAIRHILNLKYMDSVGFEEFKKVNIMPVSNRVNMLKACLMFKI